MLGAVTFIAFMTGVVILKAWRDSKDKKKDNDLWHQIGFVQLVWCASFGLLLIGVSPFLIYCTSLLLTGASVWILFDIAINKFMGEPYDHLGNSWIERTLGTYYLPIKALVFFIFLVIFVFSFGWLQ